MHGPYEPSREDWYAVLCAVSDAFDLTWREALVYVTDAFGAAWDVAQGRYVMIGHTNRVAYSGIVHHIDGTVVNFFDSGEMREPIYVPQDERPAQQEPRQVRDGTW